MATKPAKPVPEAAEAGAKPKSSKKVLVILIAVVLLAVAGGAGWFFMHGKAAPAEAKEAPKAAEPKFIALEPFTVNLQKEESDQFLQIGITLKVTDPELEEKIKQRLPEIRSHLLLLLSSKHASELTPADGKVKLSREIISEVSNTLGVGSGPAPAASSAAASGAAAEAAGHEHAAAGSGSIDVLFTSFIIQ